MSSIPKAYRFTPLVAIALVVGVSACGADEDPTGLGGSDRDGPADVGESDTGEDTIQTDTNGQDTTGSDTPVDRVLREGDVGTISVVVDGDTVHVTVDGWYHRVRIQGIAAPECLKTLEVTADGPQYLCSEDDEYWGLNSADELREVAQDLEVTVHCDQPDAGDPCPLDPFDRYLAFLDSDEGDLGELQALAGNAFSYTDYDSSRRATYCEAEDQAIADEIGMWSLGDPEEVLSRMSNGTQNWYEDRDRLCQEAQ